MFRSKDKRSQAAMEFLMTYGWAILVVLVVIGALAYFGVLNPSQLLPEKCTLPIGFNCKDFRVNDDIITITIENGAGRGVRIHVVNLTSDALDGDAGCYRDYGGVPMIIKNGKSGEVIAITVGSSDCGYNPTGRAKNRYNIVINYSWLDSRYTHMMEGELLARLEE